MTDTTAFVAQHLDFVSAQAESLDATCTAIEAFEASAIGFADALDAGVSANALAAAIKDATADMTKRDRGLAYTSAAAVGFHARTGRILLLDDDLDGTFDIRDIQTAVKKLKVAVVDGIIGSSETRGDALDKLNAAVKAAEAEAEQSDEDDEGDGDGAPVAKALDVLLKAARGPIRKVAERRTAGEPINEDAREIAREIARLLDTVLAPETVTVSSPVETMVADDGEVIEGPFTIVTVADLRDEVVLP